MPPTPAFLPALSLPSPDPTSLSTSTSTAPSQPLQPSRLPRRAAAPPPSATRRERTPPQMVARDDPLSTSDDERDANPGDTETDRPSEPDQRNIKRMRARLEGLFGTDDDVSTATDADVFDGEALRVAVSDRWGVQYDVQPQKRHGHVYIQIMWRYFEQQSFYMNEEEFANHCEAVAQLLNRWGAVEYFCDYITSIKKRPVVGVAINIRIPGIDAATATFE